MSRLRAEVRSLVAASRLDEDEGALCGAPRLRPAGFGFRRHKWRRRCVRRRWRGAVVPDVGAGALLCGGWKRIVGAATWPPRRPRPFSGASIAAGPWSSRLQSFLRLEGLFAMVSLVLWVAWSSWEAPGVPVLVPGRARGECAGRCL